MKPTKTQAEISKLEKQIAKLTGDLAQKRRLEALRAEADALQKAIKAEPCDKPHYPPPCPLPHSPWFVQPWPSHGSLCWCPACKSFYPWVSSPSYGGGYSTSGNPIITCTDGLGGITTYTQGNAGAPITVCGSTGNVGGSVSVFNTGTQASVASTPTFAIGASEN